MTTTTFFIIFIPILSVILLMVNLLLAPHNPYQEKDSVFECGFHSFLGQNRTQFSVSFFIFGLLFLLFDLEIVLIYPYSVSSYTNDIYGLIIMIVFFILLTLGFIFELGKNALTIDSRQTSLSTSTTNIPNLDVFNNLLKSSVLNTNKLYIYNYLNRVNVGLLYLLFASVFTFLIIAFSVLIKAELSGDSVEYIVDGELYSYIITLAAVLIIFYILIPVLVGLVYMLTIPKIFFFILENFYLVVYFSSLYLTVTCMIKNNNYLLSVFILLSLLTISYMYLNKEKINKNSLMDLFISYIFNIPLITVLFVFNYIIFCNVRLPILNLFLDIGVPYPASLLVLYFAILPFLIYTYGIIIQIYNSLTIYNLDLSLNHAIANLRKVNCNNSVFILLSMNSLHFILPLFLIYEKLNVISNESNLFNVVYCSSPPKLSESFKTSDTTHESLFNLSIIDKLLEDFNNNVSSLNAIRIKEAESVIEQNKVRFNQHSIQTSDKLGPKIWKFHEDLFKLARKDASFGFFENKVNQLMGQNYVNATSTDLETFWKERGTYINKLSNRSMQVYATYKDYIKQSNLDKIDKNRLFTQLNELKKMQAQTHYLDKKIIEEQISKSHILKELSKSVNK